MKTNCRIVTAVFCAFFAAFLAGCTGRDEAPVTLRIIATSDIHAKLFPKDIDARGEGSVCQLSSMIQNYYIPGSTILIDAGDLINRPEEIEPMSAALNWLGYDIFTLGNHESGLGPAGIRRVIDAFDGTVVQGNLFDPQGKLYCDAWTIRTVENVRVGFIGMLYASFSIRTPEVLEGGRVADPVPETMKALKEMRGKYDLLIGVDHMGLSNEKGVKNSGVIDYAMACPQFDVIIASHQHRQIPERNINNVFVVENDALAESVIVIDLTMKKTWKGYRLSQAVSQAVDVKDVSPDEEFRKAFSAYEALFIEQYR